MSNRAFSDEDAESRRREFRFAGAYLYPIAIRLRQQDQIEINTEVINYHYRGACIRIPETMRSQLKASALEGFHLDFYLGDEKLGSNLSFRVCWEQISTSGLCGVEFLTKKHQTIVDRAHRFDANPAIQPMLVASDPLDPHRQIYLYVCDMSETGMLTRTSLTNRHLFPGMKMRGVRLEVPGYDAVLIDVAIENARQGSEENSFLMGLSLYSENKTYLTIMREYMSSHGLHQSEEVIENLKRTGLLSKNIKKSVTYRVVTSRKQYEEVLKLRFLAYGKHKKTLAGQTYLDMGPGLNQEGMILAGYVNNRPICSMELRFGNGELPLKTLEYAGLDSLPGVDVQRLVEINKLAVEPHIQGSDVFIGMIQKAHAIVIAAGHYDVLLSATTKLQKLYKGIGAEAIGVEYPHPVLDNTTLCVMVVRKETYRDRQSINPYVWEQVYQLTHAHSAKIGMTAGDIKDLKNSWRYRLTKFLVENLRLKRRKRKIEKKPAPHKQRLEKYGYVNPKWTKQEIATSVMYPYVLEAIDLIGKDRVVTMLDEIGVPFSYIRKQSNWLSVGFHDEFIDRFAAHGSAADLCRRAGFRSMKRDVIGLNYFLLKHFVKPEIAFQSMAKIMPRFNRGRTYVLHGLKRGQVTVAVGPRPGYALPKHAESCANWTASFEGFIKLMTGKAGKISKVACCYKGDEACLYDIKWKSSTFREWSVFAGANMLFAGMVFALMGRSGIAAISVFAGVASALSLRLYIMFVREQKEKQESVNELQIYQQETNEKYRDLQDAKESLDERYQESRLLEETLRRLLNNQSLKDILRTSLQMACNSFGFDRAFVMLKDADKKHLQMAAVEGISHGAEVLWSFKVEVAERRNNAMVLSSVYHTGNSILIDDVSAHLFQLNEASRQLVDSLGTKGFIIVQIPSSEGSWGTLVADKVSVEKTLRRKDVVLLERLAQHLGVALDKQARLELEERQKMVFQKYAPAAVLQQSSMDEPALGGQLKQVGCMFVDIRGFTALTNKFPAAVIVAILNRFFACIEEPASLHGGMIDKFLGDGVLVTWGTFGDVGPDPAMMLATAQKCRERLQSLNDEFLDEGLDSLSMGIGLHIGPAIVGNVGSQNRMEFTCVGTAINLASRLEGLCKSMNAEVVASETLFQADTLYPGWVKQSGVSVRGVTEPVDVRLLRPLLAKVTPDLKISGE